MDKIQEDNLEHKRSNIQRKRKLEKKEDKMEHPEFPQPMCDIYLEKEIWSINIKREKKIRVTS